MLNIICHQRSANKNRNDTAFHTYKDSYNHEDNSMCLQEYGKTRTLIHAGENVKCHSHLKNSQALPQNVKHRVIFDPAILLPGIYL